MIVYLVIDKGTLGIIDGFLSREKANQLAATSGYYVVQPQTISDAQSNPVRG